MSSEEAVGSVFANVLLAVVAALVLGLLILLLVRFLLRRAFSRAETELRGAVARRFQPADIELISYRANFLGLESKGVRQIRGNGVLVLLTDSLHFIGATGTEITIGRSTIESVSEAKSHLRKTFFQPLLHVAYRDGAELDSAAWLVPDLANWLLVLSARGP